MCSMCTSLRFGKQLFDAIFQLLIMLDIPIYGRRMCGLVVNRIHCSAGGASSTDGLARFFFVLGQVAIQLLVHIEHVTSSVRRARLAKEKAASEAQSQPSAAQEGGPKPFNKSSSTHMLSSAYLLQPSIPSWVSIASSLDELHCT